MCRTRVLVAVLSLVTLAGCDRPRPSPDYLEARARYDSLVVALGDDAYLDPVMDEVLAGLARVPAGSVHAEAARQLRETIEQERERVSAEAARKASQVEAAPAFPAPAPEAPGPAVEARPYSPRPEDFASAPEPRTGMPLAVLVSRFGECFVEGEKVNVPALGLRARSFALAQAPGCLERFPSWANRLVLVSGRTVIGSANDEPASADSGS